MKVEGKRLPEDFLGSEKTTQALYLTTISPFLDNKLKYIFYASIPKIKNNFNMKALVEEKVCQMEKKLSALEEENCKYFTDPTIVSLINKKFSPSKTAQNGLTFVTKTEEENLWKKDQPEEILKVFRIIYLIMNENMEEIAATELIGNLIKNVLPRIQIENLSKITI